MIEISILLIIFCKGFGEFTKEKTSYLKAILPFCVMACHYCPDTLPIDNNIKFLGYFAVSTFFFISGYGLSAKYNSKGELTLKYVLTKILLLLIPLFSATILYIIILYYKTGVIIDLNIYNSLCKNELIHPLSWFVVKLILLYLFFYISSKLKYRLFTLFLLISLFMIFEKYNGIQSTYYISDLAFFAGCVYNIIGISNWNIWLRKIIYAIIVAIMLLHPAGIMSVICFMLPLFFISLFSSFVFHNNHIVSYLNQISYELFLTQCSAALVISSIINSDGYIMQFVGFLLILIYTVLLASIIKPINNIIINIMKIKKEF